MILPRRALLLATLASAASIAVQLPAARAQITVYDPAAVTQALRQVSQGLQQIQALQAQLQQQAQMLARLGVDVTGPLTSIATQATGLLQQAQGIGYNAANLSQTFAQQYPASLTGQSPAALAARLSSWNQNSRQTLQEAMQVQNQIVQAQGATTSAVGAAVSASQGAAGQTAALQATNQLLAALTTQLTQLQTLLITQARQTEILEAERQALQAKGDADAQRNAVVTRPARRFTADTL